VDSKAEYSALSSTRSQKKETQTNNAMQCPFNTVQVKNREVSPEGIRVTIWRKGFVKEMSLKSGLKGRGSDRW